MTRLFHFLGLAAVAVLMLLLTLGAAPGRAAAQTGRTISNIAVLEWGPAASRSRIQSNQVDTQVLTDAGVSAATYQIGGGTLPPELLAASCNAASGGPTGNNGPALSSYDLTPGSQFLAGRPVVLALERPSANHDPAAIESIEVHVRGASGDREVLSFTESAADSGRFLAIVATSTGTPRADGDCRLSVVQGAITLEFADSANGPALVTVAVEFLVDPFGIAFDSRDGSPVSGVRITLIDVATGQPAEVFGDDRVSTYPASVISGQAVTDSGGTTYSFPAGDYRFPFVRPGRYRLLVEPVAPYSFPSSATPQQLAALRRPDGEPFTIAAGSFGGEIVLSDPAPVRVDLPLDRPLTPIVLVKTASREDAEAGDLIQYRIVVRNPEGGAATGAITIEDRLPQQLRLRKGSVRLDNQRIADPVLSGSNLATFSLPSVAPASSAILTYLLEVRPGARAGDALNRAQARGAFNNLSNVADALVRIRRQTIGDRMTIIGRLVDGACSAEPGSRPGIAGVRVMLEDGTYAVTDREGRYHFEGIRPGTHVVQVDETTLPANRALVDCARNVRSGGRPFSRFVDGLGGGLKRADFHAVAAAPREDRATPAQQAPAVATDQQAAGADRDWLAGAEPGIDWLFPAADHNPRAPVIRVAVKHAANQTVRLRVDGHAVDPVAFDGIRKNAAGTIAVSVWRGIPLEQRRSALTAEVVDSDGRLVRKLERVVRFSNVAVRAELIRDKSRLVADGVTRPVLALRLTDSDGQPVHHGLTGEFSLPAPYYAAMEADAQQARQLAGIERARPTWRVTGDNGIALVELEPTTASGTVVLRFAFRDGTRVREQRIEAWLDPGERPWTIVGLAEGTVGFNRLAKGMESLDAKDDKLVTDGRLALYAKGRVLGRWLLTLAYDSDKKQDETRFGGVIDPRAYYTIYADRSEQRYDASSLRKLYLKLERPQFYALFGDYDTGLEEPQLARYVRSLNGAKAEYRSDQLSAVAFAADTPTRHRRDEIQGNGLTGPYALSARDILANSERIVIETRDRLRSDRIVESRLLTRHVDYDIDYLAGTLRFREPILSRSSALDPQFIVADYEVDGVASRKLSAGGRVAVRTADQSLQVGVTAVHSAEGPGASNLGGIDVRYRPSAATEIRAEVAVSRNQPGVQTPAEGEATATAWLVEAEHHAGPVDLIAYASDRDPGFGVNQLNAAEAGTRKVGIDGRVQLSQPFQLTASAWREDYHGSDARRIAGRALLEYRGGSTSARAGLVYANDRLGDGRAASSTLLQLGASQRLFDNRLELDGQAELPIGGDAESIDFPARHRLSARFSVTPAVALVGSYEIADGAHVDARTARLGFDLAPWAGARLALSGNFQTIAEYGPRSFAAYGLSQSLQLSRRLTVDVTVDGNRTLGGIDPSRVLNPLHPVASGGHLGQDGSLTEDFLAITAGATWRSERWTIAGRGEWRDGDRDRRYGATLSALRQIGEGRAVGGTINWFTADGAGGATTRTVNGEIAWAHRPAASALSFLNKLELRDDEVKGAAGGIPGPIGVPLDVIGDARSLRVINSLSVNWSPTAGIGGGLQGEVALFWGTRFVSDRYGEDDVEGWSNLLGTDVRFDLGRRVEIGFSASVRAGLGFDSVAYSGGPQVGIAPFDNGWLTLGWNVAGFADRDFSEDRYTRSGPYATLRLKFDQMSLAGLGLGRQ